MAVAGKRSTGINTPQKGNSMKYSKIAAFIKKSKHLAIHNRKGSEQWISDGCASYPVLGMPQMTPKELLTFLSFQENDNINVTEWIAEDMNFADTDPREQLIERFGPTLLINDEECATFYTSIGALLVNAAYLVPVYSHYGEGELSYYLRCSGENPYIAVKKGLYMIAAIMPVRTWGIGDLTLAKYEELCNLLRIANDNMAGREESEIEDE